MDHAASPGQNAAPETYSVLVADDDPVMAELLAINLRKLGHRVVGTAPNGRKAVELALKLRPDVVIMDLNMPLLDGFQAAREILATKLIPIVLSTGVSDIKSAKRAAEFDIISYLVKPFSPAQLKIAVNLAVAQCRKLANPGDGPANKP